VTLSFSFVPLIFGDGKREDCMHGCSDVHGRGECTHGTCHHVRASCLCRDSMPELPKNRRNSGAAVLQGSEGPELRREDHR